MKFLPGCLSLLLVFLLPVSQGIAMGERRPVAMVISGTVRVVGNAPLTRLILTDSKQGKEYLLSGGVEDDLRKRHQGEVVSLEGTLCVSTIPQFPHCFEPARIVEKAK